MKKVLEDFGIGIVVTVLLVALIGGIVAYEKWAYGDATCAIKHCVSVRK